MSLKGDFAVILTDQEFRKLIGEALYHRGLLDHNTALAVSCIKKDRGGKWRVTCERPAAKEKP